MIKGCQNKTQKSCISIHYENKAAWWTSYSWGWNAMNETNAEGEICGNYQKIFKFFFLCKDCWNQQETILTKIFKDFNEKVLEKAPNEVKNVKESNRETGITTSDSKTYYELQRKYNKQFN